LHRDLHRARVLASAVARRDGGRLVRVRPARPLRREEIAHQPLALLAQLWVVTPTRMVIRPERVEKLDLRLDRAGLLVRCSEDDERDASKDGGAGAHRARLDGHVERAIRQPPACDGACGLANGDDLGMRGRIRIDLSTIAGARDDLAVAHDRGPDRHVAVFRRKTPFLDGHTHEALVVRWPCHGCRVSEGRAAVRPILHLAWSGLSFEEGRQAMTHTDAHRRDAIPPAAALELAEERPRETRPRRTDRSTDGGRTTV